jgi:AmmeMemoRadiSam system protein A
MGKLMERAVAETADVVAALGVKHVLAIADPEILPPGQYPPAPSRWPSLPMVVPCPPAADGAAALLFAALRQAGWQGEGYTTPAPSEGAESLGCAIGAALNDDAEPCALLAYGRLAGGLEAEGGEAASARRFAELLLQGLKRDTVLLHGIPPHLLGGQNIHNALLVALSAREGAPRLLAYEVLAGIGYVAAEIYRSSPVAGFARACLTRFLAEHSIDELPVPGEPLLHEPAGCFVTLKKEGDLRGCIGTVNPTRADLAAEIRHNTVAAATQDPRFWPVAADELPLISVSVDVLGPLERIADMAELDPFVYGVVVRSRGKVGLLLPHLEGIEDARQQVDIARQKAGIWPEEEVEMWRFQAERYYE